MAATRSGVPESLRQRAGVMARFFRGMDDPTRVLILELLLQGLGAKWHLGQTGTANDHAV